MGLHRIKAVADVPAGSKNSRNMKREQSRQWSFQFLEFLLHELEEQEKSDGQSLLYRENDAHTEEEQEFDCRIVVKGEEAVPEDWDSFEVTRDFTEPILTSEIYEDIIDQVKSVGNWQANVLYKIASAILQDYYHQKLDEDAVGELFCACFQKCIEKNKQAAGDMEKQREVLSVLYEYFSRVNARKSVAANEWEGRKLVEQCGLFWAGTTYYNAEYYYMWNRMQGVFQQKCGEIAITQQIQGISFSHVERQTQFFRMGGLTFHGMFVWVQQKDNHPSNQYGMRELDRVPPKGFVYLYRNHFAQNEKLGIQLLEKRMKKADQSSEKRLWRSFTLEDGKDYHNGMSYLLEGRIMDEWDEAAYGDAMSFLQNFILYRVSGCVEYLGLRIIS